MALVVGSVFYNLDETTSSFYSRGVLLFFAILLNAFASAMEVRPQMHQLTATANKMV
jgi:ATP-binding cassette, subfamily G (WHITE), member 2, PDR